MRTAEVQRETRETRVTCRLSLDGQGHAQVQTGIGFFDHMLDQLCRHAFWDLELTAAGDLQVDAHHTVEDAGLVLGQALDQALGDRQGIARFGSCYAPLDESLSLAVIDLGGRPFTVVRAAFTRDCVGEFDTELVAEFFRALATRARAAVHLNLLYGENAHHQVESLFKAAALAFAAAAARDPRVEGVRSTKGALLT
ncbi:MAG: imidazoleglycerol-phosphate dehydratase HisB [Symbiobacteriia bacterium]